MKPHRKNIVNKIKVPKRIREIIIKWTNCDIVEKKKSEYICKFTV